jgi:(1->4)-alpha-D-glucan 1-alpha-D-glucosylmutase
LGRNRQTAILDLLEDWRDGRIKLAVIAILLAYRRIRPELFAEGGYKPLIATGPRADQILVFARCHEEDALVVAASRFPVRSEKDRDWTGTEIPRPRAAVDKTCWHDLFGGRVVERRGVGASVEAVLRSMPVAGLIPHHSGHRGT